MKAQKRKNRGLYVLVLMMLLVAGYAIYALAASTTEIAPDDVINNANSVATMQEQTSSEVQNLNYSTIVLIPAPISDIIDTGYLALINRQHGISAEPNSLTMAWPTVPVSFVDGMYLHPSALQAVADMLDTFRDTDLGTLFVSSGFRGLELQTNLYNNGDNGGFALPPGHSEHHTGLAADILAIGVSQAEMASSAEGRWLAANSYRYGLILRYPQGATHITGIEFEPWHFRYVGRPHAYYMKQHNLVLEEYIELLQTTGGVTFEMGNRTYHVLHQTPQSGFVYLPEGMEFTVSNDNMGGKVVTAWTTQF